MITTTRYGTSAWIGNLIVIPEERGRGLGSALMRHAVDHLHAGGAETLRLEADPLGVNIYRRHGFVGEFVSPRFRLDEPPKDSGWHCAPVTRDELDAIAAFDAAAFGEHRGRLLRLLAEVSPAVVRVPARGAVSGYLMLQPSGTRLRVGPWVATEPHAAAELLRAACGYAAGRPLVVAVPGPNRLGQDLLRSCGFAETPSSTRMVRGAGAAHGVPEMVYAMASGAVG